MELIGLIAGNGNFPVTFAREARRRGYRIAAVAHRDETDPAIEAEVAQLGDEAEQAEAVAAVLS